MIIFKSHVKKELKVGLKEGGVLKKGDFQKQLLIKILM